MLTCTCTSTRTEFQWISCTRVVATYLSSNGRPCRQGLQPVGGRTRAIPQSGPLQQWKPGTDRTLAADRAVCLINQWYELRRFPAQAMGGRVVSYVPSAGRYLRLLVYTRHLQSTCSGHSYAEYLGTYVREESGLVAVAGCRVSGPCVSTMYDHHTKSHR